MNEVLRLVVVNLVLATHLDLQVEVNELLADLIVAHDAGRNRLLYRTGMETRRFIVGGGL